MQQNGYCVELSINQLLKRLVHRSNLNFTVAISTRNSASNKDAAVFKRRTLRLCRRDVRKGFAFPCDRIQS